MQELLQNQIFFVVLVVWSLFWKGLVLWRAAKLNQKVWYVIILILNTLGILEIIYLIITHKKVNKKKIAGDKIMAANN